MLCGDTDEDIRDVRVIVVVRNEVLDVIVDNWSLKDIGHGIGSCT